MPIRLVHQKVDEAREKVEKLSGLGYEVICEPIDQKVLKNLRHQVTEALVVDLTRLPSHGREVALAVRTYKATRHVPIVFVEGAEEKVARIKELLPDAVYTTWRGIRGALKRAIAHPPKDPCVPTSVMAAYSGAPLPKKLGIKEGSVVILSGAPAGFEKVLGSLPNGVTLRKRAQGRCDLLIWFTRTVADLERRIVKLGNLAGDDGLWICWPKKASGVKSDLTQAIVRKTGLNAGLVDYKICSVDETWSGLKFARRK